MGANRGFGDFETGCNHEEKSLFESLRGTVMIAYVKTAHKVHSLQLQ
jgi:hypothetical protein